VMKQVVRTGIAFLLIGIILYNSMGYLMVFPALRMIHRQQVTRMLSDHPDKELVTLSFPKGMERNYKVPGEKELRYNDKMYDIVRVIDDEKTITYICYEDEKEDLLIKKSKDFSRSMNTDPKARTAGLILSGIIKIALISEEAYHFPILPSSLHFFCSFIPYHAPDRSIPELPPRFLS